MYRMSYSSLTSSVTRTTSEACPTEGFFQKEEHETVPQEAEDHEARIDQTPDI